MNSDFWIITFWLCCCSGCGLSRSWCYNSWAGRCFINATPLSRDAIFTGLINGRTIFEENAFRLSRKKGEPPTSTRWVTELKTVFCRGGLLRVKSDANAVSFLAANRFLWNALVLSREAVIAELWVQDCAVGQQLTESGLRIVGEPRAFRF